MTERPIYKILIIDDDDLFLESTALFLEDLGHTTLRAESGEKALDMYGDFSPDIVLVDLNMPGINGIQVVEAITRQTPDTPSIMISGTGEIQDALDAMRRGAWDFITKPIMDFVVLEHAIGKVMDRAELIRKNREYQEELRQHNDLLEEKVERRTRELHKAKTAAENANRTKSEFLANITHELRTPLHGILNFSELGISRIDRYTPERQLDFLQEIHNSGERLLGLINNLLDLAMLDSGRIEYDFTDQHLSPIVLEAISRFEKACKEKQILIEFSQPTFEDTAPVDRERLSQVMDNLISNAIKFSPVGSCVRIQISEDSENLILTITDEGVGIPEAELNDIFDAFTQSSETDDGSGGTGLGLPICLQIIQHHGGTIHANNNPEGGATFTFTLPKKYIIRKKLGEILIEEKVITEGTLYQMLKKQEE